MRLFKVKCLEFSQKSKYTIWPLYNLVFSVVHSLVFALPHSLNWLEALPSKAEVRYEEQISSRLHLIQINKTNKFLHLTVGPFVHRTLVVVRRTKLYDHYIFRTTGTLSAVQHYTQIWLGYDSSEIYWLFI